MRAGQLKVLLVEDNAASRDMLSRRLRRAGYEVCTAADGAQALRQARALRPGIVLMDMSLPIKDGWTACRELRQAPDTAEARIIALTAHAMAEDLARAMAAGCDDYATKPVDFPELLRKIEHWAGAARQAPAREGAQ